MLEPVFSGQFRRDVKRVEKRGKDMAKLKTVVQMLIAGDQLSERYRDHPLRGNWNGYRDLHLEPDWLLIYKIVGQELHLARTGSHADLFAD